MADLILRKTKDATLIFHARTLAEQLNDREVRIVMDTLRDTLEQRKRRRHALAALRRSSDLCRPGVLRPAAPR